MRLALVVSHPIQYHAPFFRRLAAEPGIDLTVYYLWDFGVVPTHDPEFRVKVKWDIPVLEGYRSIFLKNIAPRPSAKPWGEINPGIVRVLAKGNYDAVVFFGWNFVSSWLGFFTCMISDTPFFLRGENPWSQEVRKPLWKRFIKKAILWPLFDAAAGLLYIGKENKEFYSHYGVPDKKLFFVPYMADNARFMAAAKELAPQRAELKKELGLAPDAVVIPAAGKLIHKKRPLDLLEAYIRFLLHPTRYTLNPALVYMGDGELRGEIERRVLEEKIPNVIITGFRNQTEMPRVYAAADIFVLPSEAGETWGLVVNEAMCFGLPIVLSNNVGCGPDLLRKEENGLMVATGDVDGLAHALTELAGNPAERKLFGDRSREIVAEYSFETGVRGIKEALEALKKPG